MNLSVKTLDLEVWIGKCAKIHSGIVDPLHVNVVIKGLSFHLPQHVDNNEFICFSDYRKACFYIDDWCDIIRGLSNYECNFISCLVHFEEEDNIKTLSGKVCADMLERRANNCSVDFDKLELSVSSIESLAVRKKPFMYFELTLGFSCQLCQIREKKWGIPHSDITEGASILFFDDFESIIRYVESWGDVFEFFGKSRNDLTVKVTMNILSLNRVFRYDKLMILLNCLRNSYSRDMRAFPEECL